MSELAADRVSVAFAGLKALSDVSLNIASGQVLGLIGPNGAGKTTLVNVLTGFQAPTGGAVRLDGAPLSDLKPHEMRRRGIARTFQGGRLFRDLPVIDNLEVTGLGLGLSRHAAIAEAEAMLDWIGIAPLAGRIAGTLPYTDERRVAIARALVTGPDFLLLDEPAAGMSDHECDELMVLVRSIPQEHGCGVLLIEHNMSLVLGLCDRIHVLDGGRTLAEGSPAEVRADRAVIDAYLGAEA